MATDDRADLAAVNSIWWYGVAFAAVWGLVAWVLFVGYASSGGSATGPSAELTLLAIGILAVNPLSLYLDIGAIERSGVEWSPNERLYLAGALVGIPATLFSSFVAVAYLYRRHRNVGTP